MEYKFKVGDKVRVLDGERIPDYTGTWTSRMKEYVGKVMTIRSKGNYHGRPCYDLQDDPCYYTWDERGLADANDPVKKVIFNRPATIVFWTDGTKTVVKAHNEPYDPEKGLAMCFTKKMLGNNSKYNAILKSLTEGVVGDSVKDYRNWNTYYDPMTSGYYEGITDNGAFLSCVGYSKKWNMWNTHDDASEESAHKHSLNIIAWREKE